MLPKTLPLSLSKSKFRHVPKLSNLNFQLLLLSTTMQHANGFSISLSGGMSWVFKFKLINQMNVKANQHSSISTSGPQKGPKMNASLPIKSGGVSPLKIIKLKDLHQTFNFFYHLPCAVYGLPWCFPLFLLFSFSPQGPFAFWHLNFKFF